MSGQGNFRPPPLFDPADSGLADGRVYLHPSIASALRNRAALEPIALAVRDERRRRRIDAALQTALALLTLAAIGLLTSGAEYARWGHVAGLASQPFWLAASWRARQWGMFLVALALCVLWARGIVASF